MIAARMGVDFALMISEIKPEGDEVVVQLIGLPGGITSART
jgi:hypothetical protein